MESGPPPGFRKPPAEVRESRESPDFRRVVRHRRSPSECRNSVASRPSVRASPPDNGPAIDFAESSPAREAWERAIRRDPRSTRVPPEQTFHRPCPGKSDRANRDEKRLRTRRVPLSVPPQSLLTLARPPPNPQAGVPESPGPRGQRMANENDWPSSCVTLFRFATFDAGCRLQMALGVKRKWKKRKDGGKDYPGQPETAHMHEIHDVIPNRRSHSPLALRTSRRIDARHESGLSSRFEHPQDPPSCAHYPNLNLRNWWRLRSV